MPDPESFLQSFGHKSRTGARGCRSCDGLLDDRREPARFGVGGERGGEKEPAVEKRAVLAEHAEELRARVDAVVLVHRKTPAPAKWRPAAVDDDLATADLDPPRLADDEEECRKKIEDERGDERPADR